MRSALAFESGGDALSKGAGLRIAACFKCHDVCSGCEPMLDPCLHFDRASSENIPKDTRAKLTDGCVLLGYTFERVAWLFLGATGRTADGRFNFNIAIDRLERKNIAGFEVDEWTVADRVVDDQIELPGEFYGAVLFVCNEAGGQAVLSWKKVAE
ncbi:hypothetical protein AZOA_25550 [Azoarcus sp. Aa7]|nr:hypothetical protein [Azoarcus sp. Aa7]